MIYKPARIRFDDVINFSSNPKLKNKEIQKFLKQLRWCSNLDVLLTPAILCEDTEKVPGAIEMLQELSKKDNIQLDLHGWNHSDYASKTKEEISEHFDKALSWFDKYLKVKPVRFVTPHGGYSENIQEVSDKYGLLVETTKPPVADVKTLESMVRQTRDLKIIQNRVVLVHWFEQGLRLWRLAHIIEHQSIEQAIEITKEEFSKKEHRAIWKNWHLINV